MDGEDSRSSTKATTAWNSRIWFLWGWGILTLLAGTFTLISWLASWIIPSAFSAGTFVALTWGLCLIWLAVFLEDWGFPLAALIASFVWLIYSTFEIGSNAGVPNIIAGGCLVGGSLGGMIGGMIRKVNRSSQTTSMMLTLIGSLLGFVLGYAALALFGWLMWA